MKPQIKNQYRVLQKIAMIFLSLMIGYSAFAQENVSRDTAIRNGWWNSVLKKHNIDPEKYNYKNTFFMGTNDPATNIHLELGVTDSLTNVIVQFRNAIIFAYGDNQTYWIYRAEYAIHNTVNNIITLRNGHIASYDFNSLNTVATDSAHFKELIVDIKNNRIESR